MFQALAFLSRESESKRAREKKREKETHLILTGILKNEIVLLTQ